MSSFVMCEAGHSYSTILGLISVMLMAIMIYVMSSTMQLYLMDLASGYSKSAKDFAASLTPVSANIGITLGSVFGSIVMANGRIQDLSWVGGLVALIASLLAFVSYKYNIKQVENTVQ
jgi:predicted MFS family arabinose efflux permease